MSFKVKDLAELAKKHKNKLENEACESLEGVFSSLKSIAVSYWGKAWCKHIFNYQELDLRLERGRTYLRHGCVLDLKIKPFLVTGIVTDVEIHKPKIKWYEQQDNHELISLIKTEADFKSLLSGSLSENLASKLFLSDSGLFPKWGEMRYSCTCDDAGDLCAHVAALLYGMAVKIDASPDLFFHFRGLNLLDILKMEQNEMKTKIETKQLESIFNIEIVVHNSSDKEFKF